MWNSFRWEFRARKAPRTGRHLYFRGKRPKALRAKDLRRQLERALPHLRGEPLKRLIYEYWACGEPFDDLHIGFDYSPQSRRESLK